MALSFAMLDCPCKHLVKQCTWPCDRKMDTQLDTSVHLEVTKKAENPFGRVISDKLNDTDSSLLTVHVVFPSKYTFKTNHCLKSL